MATGRADLVERASWRTATWAVEAGTAVGLRRSRQEDAVQVVLDASLGRRRADAFAVFDGVGGGPNGDLASQAAAGKLAPAMSRARHAG